MKMKVSVWARSPSPPAKKSKDAAKAASAKPVEASKKDVKDEFGRDAVAKKEEVKAKKEKVESSSESSSDSSSSSSSDSSSESSDSSVDRRKKSSSKKKKSSSKHHSKSKKSSKKSKSKGKNKSRKHSKRRRDSSSSSDSSSDSSSSDSDSEHASKKLKSSSSRTESKPSLDAPVGGNFDEFDKDEMSRFRMEVQGGKAARSAGASGGAGYDSESDDDQDFGPMPMVQPKEYGEDKRLNYGGALLPGEGDAIAMYVQQNMRIPRRGEIGWKGDEIEGLENQGFVMSGSRHARMNAVRLRKENQVYSAEEKRALALITFEEKQQKENKVVGDFRAMLTKQAAGNGEISMED
eukprot:gene15340-17554_t